MKEYNDGLSRANLNKPDEKISLAEFKFLVQLIWNENSLESILTSAFRKIDKEGTGEKKIKYFKNEFREIVELYLKKKVTLKKLSSDLF